MIGSATPTYSIRPARAGDAPVVHALVLAAWASRVDPRSSGHRLTLAEVAELIDSRAGGAFLATAGDEPARSVCWALDGDTVEVMKLATSPAHRGVGLGPAHLKACAEVARTRGARRAASWPAVAAAFSGVSGRRRGDS